MSWQVAVILTGVISALAQMVGKRQVSKMGAFQGGVIRDGTTLLLVIVILLFNGGIPWGLPWQAIVIFGVGLMESVSMALYFAAQRTEMAATAVFSYPFSQLLIILLSGFAFGEWKYFDVQTMQGAVNLVALALTLTLMIVYQGGKGRLKSRIRWSNALVLSAIIVAISNLQSKWAVSTLHYAPAQAMIYEYAGLLTGGLLYVKMRKQTLKVGWENAGWGVVQGFLYGVSAFWYIALLTDHPLGISSVMRRVTIVLMTVAAGLWGWGEHQRLTWRQLLALLMGLVVFGLVMTVNQ